MKPLSISTLLFLITPITAALGASVTPIPNSALFDAQKSSAATARFVVKESVEIIGLGDKQKMEDQASLSDENEKVKDETKKKL